MLEHRKGSRIKTEGCRLMEEIDRQRSIFKNLSWQVQQRDRKISFLQKYYLELQKLIQKQKQDDSLLYQRARKLTKNRKLNYGHRSHLIGPLQAGASKRRLATEMCNEQEAQTVCQSDLLETFGQRSAKAKK